MKIEKQKSKGTLVVIIILSLVIVGLAGYVVYDKGVFAGKKESNTKTGAEDKTGNKEIVITDNSIIKDLSEKVTALNTLSGLSGTVRADNGSDDRSVAINIFSTTGEMLYKNKLTDEEKLNIVLLNYVNFGNVTVEEAKKRNPPYIGQATVKDVEDAYIKLFGAKPSSYEASGHCPWFSYDPKNEVYYTVAECGDVGSDYLFIYKNKFTMKNNEAYVYVNVGHSGKDGDYLRKSFVYNSYDNELKNTALDIFAGDSMYKIDSSNYKKFDEYKFIFVKGDYGNYYFQKVEKVEKEITNSDYSSNPLTKYVGEWYENKNTAYQSPNSVIITRAGENSIIANIYFTEKTYFKDFTVNINDNKGTFTTELDRTWGVGNVSDKVTGEIELLENKVKVTINSSNVSSIKANSEYVFNYQKWS